jgi:hypothetical protein
MPAIILRLAVGVNRSKHRLCDRVFLMDDDEYPHFNGGRDRDRV